MSGALVSWGLLFLSAAAFRGQAFEPSVRFERIGVREGLGHFSVRDVIQDSDGFSLTLTFDQTTEVGEFEMITVPFGTFEAVKVDQSLVTSDGQQSATFLGTVWLAAGLGVADRHFQPAFIGEIGVGQPQAVVVEVEWHELTKRHPQTGDDVFTEGYKNFAVSWYCHPCRL